MQAVAEASAHLATYEAQQLHASIKGFKEELLQMRAQGAPRKRFSFARRPSPALAEPERSSTSGAGASAQIDRRAAEGQPLSAEPSSSKVPEVHAVSASVTHEGTEKLQETSSPGVASATEPVSIISSRCEQHPRYSHLNSVL